MFSSAVSSERQRKRRKRRRSELTANEKVRPCEGGVAGSSSSRSVGLPQAAAPPELLPSLVDPLVGD